MLSCSRKTIQAMEQLLLKELREEDFGHELQQMFLLFSGDLDKFKWQIQLKTLIRISDEKQVGIKDAIKIVWSLYASQKLLVFEMLKLIKLILTVPATNGVSEISCLTLRRLKTYLRSSMTQERLNSSLILATWILF